MEGHGRRFGWIGVVLGALALAIALVGLGSYLQRSARGASRASHATEAREAGRPSDRQQKPAPQAGARHSGKGGDVIFGWARWLFAPFAFSRWLFHQAVLVGLILLACAFIRRRNMSAAHERSAPTPASDDTPSTGETRNL